MKLACKFFCVLLCSALFSSCASNEATTQLQVAEDRFRSLENPIAMIFYELIDTSKLSEQERISEEKRTFEAFAPVCAKAYTEQLVAGMNHAAQVLQDSGSRASIDNLSSYAETLDKFFSECVGHFGARGYNYMETRDGQELRMPQYLSLWVASIDSVKNAQGQVQYEKQQSMAIFAAAALAIGAGMAVSNGSYSANPDRIHIDPYRKHDGTYVQGHWKTVPNYTCLDNINGCR